MSMSEVVQSPRSSVFTTMRFSRSKGVFLFDEHISRMRQHAERLRIVDTSITLDSFLSLLVETPPEIQEGLVRIECNTDSQLKVSYREFSIQNEYIDAVTVPSPVWPKRIAGTKHGAWSPYTEAREHAERLGSDLALFVHDFAIVDGDRCSPIIMDEDGVLWNSNSPFSIDSVMFHCLRKSLVSAGFFVQSGLLNERLVARCSEAIAVGSGVGVFKIESIDSEQIGDGGSRLFDACVSLLEEQYADETNWTGVWD